MAKYRPFPRVDLPDREWPDRTVTKAPSWCSVDLRDGNQALATPMNVDKKLEFFQLLVNTGFKEIEVGFPSASQIEFDFIRRLIDEGRVPDDVSLQVLTQAREHLIRRTFESLRGAKKAVLHLYNSTSALQRDVTFNMSKEEIKQLAVDGAALVHSLIPELRNTEIAFEYSPESFSGTEIDYALEVCEAVMEVWEKAHPGTPNLTDRIILNLPATVEETGPHAYADQIEWFCRNMKRREKAIISLHTHNDRGTGVAATELGLLAGADRVEGTLFGNGERTGNVDILNIALNMLSDGIDTGLRLGDVPQIRSIYERCTGMRIDARHPYAGDLVFTAFSGSHQDAIKKGMDRYREAADTGAAWRVPYLPIDPRDIGRTYEAIIRINSQSGKGGVAYVLSRQFDLELPKRMQPGLGHFVNTEADKLGRELTHTEIHGIFEREFLNRSTPLRLHHYAVETDDEGHTRCTATVDYNGEAKEISGNGNGPISAFLNAMENAGWNGFDVGEFHEQSIGAGSGTEAVAYVLLSDKNNEPSWGAGRHTDITAAGLKAVISAHNRLVARRA